jgi:multidrug efflux pump subunit AcrA (membrane-fusion protein)
MLKNKRWITGVLLMIAIGVGAWLIWQRLHPQGLPDGFASGNGRIEGTEVDVSTKLAGRIAEILVNEGDFVTAGQVVARMDTAVFDAQLAQAKAQLRQAQNAQNTAALTCGQRDSLGELRCAGCNRGCLVRLFADTTQEISERNPITTQVTELRPTAQLVLLDRHLPAEYLTDKLINP